MDVLKAAFNVVHDGQGGSEAIAELLGKRRGTIDHEVNPPVGATAKFGLVDAVKVTKYRRDYRILYAFAEECDHICIPRPEPLGGDPSTELILRTATNLSREFAESFEKLHGALADGNVSSADLMAYESEALDVMGALAEVVRAMRGKMEADVAAHHAAVALARTK